MNEGMCSLHVRFTDITCEICSAPLEAKNYPRKMRIFCPNKCDEYHGTPILGMSATDDVLNRLAMGTIETEILWQTNPWVNTAPAKNVTLAVLIVFILLMAFIIYGLLK